MMLRVVLFFVILSPYVLARHDIIKRQKALFACLTDQSKINTKNVITGNACIKKCVSEKLGLIDSSGNPIESNYDANELAFVQDCDMQTKQDDLCLRVDVFEICLDGKREEHQELMKKQCREESNYTDSSADDNSRAACYHKCLAIKNGVLSEDGNIVVEAIKTFIGGDGHFEEYIEKCKQESQNLTGCENAIFVLQCVIENTTVDEDI